MSLPWKPNPGVTEDEALAVGGAIINLALAHKEAIAMKLPFSLNPGVTVDNVLFVIADMFELSPDLVRPGEGLKRKRIMEKVREEMEKKVVVSEETVPKKKTRKAPVKKDKAEAEEKETLPTPQMQNSNTAAVDPPSSAKPKPPKSRPTTSGASKATVAKKPAPKRPSATKTNKTSSGPSHKMAKAYPATRDSSPASSTLSTESSEALLPGPQLMATGALPTGPSFAPSYWQPQPSK